MLQSFLRYMLHYTDFQSAFSLLRKYYRQHNFYMRCLLFCCPLSLPCPAYFSAAVAQRFRCSAASPQRLFPVPFFRSQVHQAGQAFLPALSAFLCAAPWRCPLLFAFRSAHFLPKAKCSLRGFERRSARYCFQSQPQFQNQE